MHCLSMTSSFRIIQDNSPGRSVRPATSSVSATLELPRMQGLLVQLLQNYSINHIFGADALRVLASVAVLVWRSQVRLGVAERTDLRGL